MLTQSSFTQYCRMKYHRYFAFFFLWAVEKKCDYVHTQHPDSHHFSPHNLKLTYLVTKTLLFPEQK
jgi:hypothetical protein